jgi:hypothetical protein
MTTFSRPVIVGSTAADWPASAISRRTASRIARDIDAVDSQRAAIRSDQGGHEVDERRLARAVRSEQRHDLARLHREVQALERLGLAEELAEAGGLQCRIHL